MKASLNHLRMRFPRLMAVLLCTLLLGGCSQLLPDPVRSAQSTLVPGVDTVLPDAEPAEAATSLRLRGSALPCPGNTFPDRGAGRAL